MAKYNLSSKKKFFPVLYGIIFICTGYMISKEKKQKKEYENTIFNFLKKIKEYQEYDGMKDNYIMTSYVKKSDDIFTITTGFFYQDQPRLYHKSIFTKQELFNLGEKLYKAYLNPTTKPDLAEYMSYAKIIFENGQEIYVEEIDYAHHV